MGYTEKIDALDLVITLLKDHEGELNNIIGDHEDKLSKLIEKLEKMIPNDEWFVFSGTIRKWGNSKGAYIPKSIWEMADIDVGDQVDYMIRKRRTPIR